MLMNGESEHTNAHIATIFYIGNIFSSCPVRSTVLTQQHRSQDKFRSRGRWPAFRKAATSESIKLRDDYSFGLQRKEIVCAKVFMIQYFQQIPNLTHELILSFSVDVCSVNPTSDISLLMEKLQVRSHGHSGMCCVRERFS
jgi:hypothetical protein